MNLAVKDIPLLQLVLLILVFSSKAYSQTDTLAKSIKEHDQGTESPVPVHALYAGVGFGSNLIYLGSTISNNHPFYASSITYGYRNSFYISASGSHVNGINPFMAFYSLSFDYNHVFNSWFDISADLSGYKTLKSLQKTLFNDFVFLNLTAGFDWKLIYTQLSFGGLASDKCRGYIQIKNSRYFETPRFFKGKGLISFDPDFNILLGELVRTEYTSGSTKVRNLPPFRHFNKITDSTIKSYTYYFGLMSCEFSIPVTFSYGNFSIEAEPDYILPSYANSDYPAPKGLLFFLNIVFRIL